MFEVVFFLIVCIISFAFFRVIREWLYNKSQPRVAAEAKVVTKRVDYSTRHHTDDFHHTVATHYVTFEFTTGDRKEFSVREGEYGLLRDDDRGTLTFQGNQFISFQRVVP